MNKIGGPLTRHLRVSAQKVIVYSRPLIQCRLLSSETNGDEPSLAPFQLPSPTWSVEKLGLSKQHEPVSEEELRKLARRALLDMDQLDETTREKLRQDVGNMMHMIAQVQSFQYNGEELSDADIYDKPRGVLSAPLRKDVEEFNDDRRNEIAERVWSSFLEPNTTKVGAFNYFSIQTKKDPME